MLITISAIHWPRNYATAKQRTDALRMLAEGKTPTPIAEAVGVHPNTVINWRKAAARKAKQCSIT